MPPTILDFLAVFALRTNLTNFEPGTKLSHTTHKSIPQQKLHKRPALQYKAVSGRAVWNYKITPSRDDRTCILNFLNPKFSITCGVYVLLFVNFSQKWSENGHAFEISCLETFGFWNLSKGSNKKTVEYRLTLPQIHDPRCGVRFKFKTNLKFVLRATI